MKHRDPAKATRMTEEAAADLVARLTEDEGDEGDDGLDPWTYQAESFGNSFVVSVHDGGTLLGYL